MGKKRLQREKDHIAKMISLYCRLNHHHKHQLCEKCQAQLDYAMLKIRQCPFKEQKPSCKRCNIHCYKPDAAKATREVIRSTGLRMLIYHPILRVRYLLDRLRF